MIQQPNFSAHLAIIDAIPNRIRRNDVKNGANMAANCLEKKTTDKRTYLFYKRHGQYHFELPGKGKYSTGTKSHNLRSAHGTKDWIVQKYKEIIANHPA